MNKSKIRDFIHTPDIAALIRATGYAASTALLTACSSSDRAEERLRIEVILAGFIDDPKPIVLLGCGIAQCHVDFAFLERGRITLVFHADDQLLCLCLCHGRKAGA
jgi:hypothetical protein